MTVRLFTVNPFSENTYIVHDDERAVVIDPGFYGAGERSLALEYLREYDLTVSRLLLTHGHIDHIIDCAYWTDTFDMGFAMHRADLPLMEQAGQQALMFGIEMHDPPIPTDFLEDGDTIEIGSSSWQVLLAPGHSPGSICFYDEADGFVIAGDVLFMGSIGRTDLWKGSMSVLLNSIQTICFIPFRLMSVGSKDFECERPTGVGLCPTLSGSAKCDLPCS